jgi:hypothetical protein
VPIDPAALSARFYQRDGMHLNSEGAVLFTSALARDLPERVMAREMTESYAGRIPSHANAALHVSYHEH